MPQRLIRAGCDGPTLAVATARELLANDGVDLSRLLSLRCFDPLFDGWEVVSSEAVLDLSRCRAIEGTRVLELLLVLSPALTPELQAAIVQGTPRSSLKGEQREAGQAPMCR